ncbi:MAG: DUF5683 domain-containing protein [Bacteroidales bacterium]|nr:DUF5683 domain-containing protein [Bacteroidales bacterium]
MSPMTTVDKPDETTEVKVPKAKKPHNPKKATIMSACLPGLGQIYNRKWWKVPIIYAGIGGIGYKSLSNHREYISCLNAYKYKSDPEGYSGPLTQHEKDLAERYGKEQLQAYKESYRHDFELYTIILAAWYGLNIIDACVDGHLYNYDISDDLSFSIDPMLSTERGFYPNAPLAQAGLSFKLTF